MTRCLACDAVVRRGSYCDACQRARDLVRTTRRGGTGYERQVANRRIIERDGGCVMADDECYGDLEVDHIVEIVDGGSDDDSNKQTLCTRHHSRKSIASAAARRAARTRGRKGGT